MLTSLPTLPLLTIGGCCAGLAIVLRRQQQREDAREAAEARAQLKALLDELTRPPLHEAVYLGAVGNGEVDHVEAGAAGVAGDGVAGLIGPAALLMISSAVSWLARRK